jgi:ElaB/YqjD/DUF883 family membrane-anchored ribosome-binding protein
MTHSSKKHHQFVEGVQKLGSDVDELKQNISGLVSDAASTAQAGLAQVGKEVKRKVRAGQAEAAEKIDDLSDHIAQYPLRSVAVAFGMGLFIGAVFVGRK